MKRDLDLFRSILFRTEEIEPNTPNYDDLDFEGYDPDTVVEHARLMHEAGLIEAEFTEMIDGSYQLYSVRRLLNPGHDMLAAVRNDTVWNRTKEKVSKTVGTATLEVVKSVAEGVAKGMLNVA